MNQLVADIDQWYQDNWLKIKDIWSDEEIKTFSNAMDVIQNAIEEMDKINEHIIDDMVNEKIEKVSL